MLGLAPQAVRIVAGHAARDKVVELDRLSLRGGAAALDPGADEMSIDVDGRKHELLALKDRVLRAAHDIVSDDTDDSELSPSAAGGQHLADHASEMLDQEVDESLGETPSSSSGRSTRRSHRIEDARTGRAVAAGSRSRRARGGAVRRALRRVQARRGAR